MLKGIFNRSGISAVEKAPATDVETSEREQIASAGLRAAYLGILGREPDEAGFADNLRFFDEEKFEDAMSTVLGTFMKSSEAAPILMSYLVNRMRHETAKHRITNLPTFRHLISLGWNCMPSSTFKRHGLKRYSLPFDWIFSGPDVVDHMIRDEFREMMSPRNHLHVPVEERPSPNLGLCDHRFYLENFGVKDMFNHYDPSIAEDRGYLGRCIYRFKKLYALDEPKLYVATVRDEKYSPQVASSLNDALHANSKNSKLLFVRLGAAPEGSFTPIVTSEQHGRNFEVVRFLGLGDLTDVIFPNMLDEAAFMWMLMRHDIQLSATIPD
ncbi:DUF1796 family putative cysteine peptidase [Burkholderia cepacia]|uniref:DUF1796 family putative cysteine peptidase n=1 Tax=Burkholderia cepacia TaxID=292 RepID=UPI002FE2350D